MNGLTKEIADSIRNAHSVSRFFFLGSIDGFSFYKALFIHGGKNGFPCVFGLDANGTIKWIQDFGTLSSVYKKVTSLEEVFV